MKRGREFGLAKQFGKAGVVMGILVASSVPISMRIKVFAEVLKRVNIYHRALGRKVNENVRL